MVRFEDIAPGTADPAILVALTKQLESRGVPFSVGVIPIFKDPHGLLSPPGTELHLDDAPDLVAALHFMEAHGGTLVMHGVTHQHDSGTTGNDWEFSAGPDGAPLPYDAEAWAHARLMAGRGELRRHGFVPWIWETPHYSASHGDYLVFADHFAYGFEWPLVFPRRVDAAPEFGTFLAPSQQLLPYATATGASRMGLLPVTLGYVNASEPDHTPEALLAAADRLAVVRDGVASFYFHHKTVPASDLLAVVDGLQRRGYKFVSPAELLGLKRPPTTKGAPAAATTSKQSGAQ